MKRWMTLALSLMLIFVVLGCEEEEPDYAADVINTYIIESMLADGETWDLSDLPIEMALFVKITRDAVITYMNEDYCSDTYVTETEAIDSFTETEIVMNDGSEYPYEFSGDKLIITDAGDVLTLVVYDGVVPPPVWSDPTLLTNDSYEPNNDMITATAMVVDAPAQAHYMGDCGDQDYFGFTAVEGTNYVLATTTDMNSELDLTLTLYDATGTEIAYDDDSSDWNPLLEWSCTSSGLYYFMIEGFWYDEVGNYSVSVVTSTTIAKQVSGPERAKKSHHEAGRVLPAMFF